MVTNTKKVINFLSAGRRPAASNRAKHGRFRTFRAAPRGLRLRHATKHLKRYNYDLSHLCCGFFWPRTGICRRNISGIYGISATNNLLAPHREPLWWVFFSFPEGTKCPDPSGGPRGP